MELIQIYITITSIKAKLNNLLGIRTDKHYKLKSSNAEINKTKTLKRINSFVCSYIVNKIGLEIPILNINQKEISQKFKIDNNRPNSELLVMRHTNGCRNSYNCRIASLLIIIIKLY